MIDSIKEVEYLFPTIVYRSHDLNFSSIKDDLINEVYKVKETDPGGGVVKSNYGGWQSTTDLCDNLSDKNIQYIVDRIYDTLPEYLRNSYRIQGAWAAVNGPGDFNWTHFHTEALLSGVIWLKIVPAGGEIRLENPNEYPESPNILKTPDMIREQTKNMLSMHFKPQEGEMMIFPAWLRHAVTPNESTQDRISIAFNLT